jgi:hypothetical protein
VTLEYNIRRTAGWHRYEAETLTIAHECVDTSCDALRFVICRQAGGTPLLDLDGCDTVGCDPQITGGMDETTVLINPATDYALLPAGDYYYELWDTADAVLLVFGSIHLAEGTAPVEECA